MHALGSGQSPRVGRGPRVLWPWLSPSTVSDLVLFWPVGNDKRDWREEGRQTAKDETVAENNDVRPRHRAGSGGGMSRAGMAGSAQ